MEAVAAGLAQDSESMRKRILENGDYEQLKASAQVLVDLRRMVNDPAFSDVTFVCNDGERIQGLRRLLANRSDVLKSMLMNGMAESRASEIAMPEISSPVLLAVFEFLYTGNILDYHPGSWSRACETIIASRFFLLPNLEIIMRKYLCNRTFDVAKDLTQVASLLTEAVAFDGLCDDTDFCKRELATILSSNSSHTEYFRNLSEDALSFVLSLSEEKVEDDENLSFREYNRLRQVILRLVYESDIGSRVTEEFLNYIAPDDYRALSLLSSPTCLKVVEVPQEDASRLESERKSFPLDERAKNSAIRLLSNIDLRRIPPVLLEKVVEPLGVVSSEALQSAFRFHALRRPMKTKTVSVKTLECGWVHGEYYRVSHNGYVIQKTRNGIGTAVMETAMSRTRGVYLWRVNLEEACGSFCEIGLVYLGAGETLPDCQRLQYDRLSYVHLTRTLKIEGSQASVNFNGAWSTREDWRILGSAFRVQVSVVFNYNASNRDCSLSIDGQDYGVVWRNLNRGAFFYPAVSLGTTSTGRAHIELMSGFDTV